MSTREKKNPREKRQAIKVYLTTEEHQTVSMRAASVNLDVSTFLRRLGLEQQLTSRLLSDGSNLHDAVGLINKLFEINGDIGRLGGLFKLWLSGSHDELCVPTPEGPQRADVERVLSEFNSLRATLLGAIDEFRSVLQS